MIGNNIYKGFRYVPKNAGDWIKDVSYEALTVVQYQGNSYTSKICVPRGIEITDTRFWVQTANYNQQFENLRDTFNTTTAETIKELNDFKSKQDNEFADLLESHKNNVNTYVEEMSATLEAEREEINRGGLTELKTTVENNHTTTIEQFDNTKSELNNLNSLSDFWGYKGLCIRNWIEGGFSGEYFKGKIDEAISKLKIDSICIVYNTYQQSSTSTNVEYRSPVTEVELNEIIKYCKDKNLKIMIKPHVESDDGVWRASYNPTDKEEWFNSYKTFILKSARICANNNVDIMCVGSEYRSLTTTEYKDKWVDIINEIRKIYKGNLTYGANCNTVNNDEIMTLSFWQYLDIIGVDNYLKPTENVETLEPAYDSLMQNNYQGNNIIQPLDVLYNKYNKPIVFCEYGVGHDNITYRTNYLKAYLKNYGSCKWNRGMFLWVIDPDTYSRNFNPLVDEIVNVMSSFYSMNTKPVLNSNEGIFKTLVNNSSTGYYTKIATLKMYNTSIEEGSIKIYREQNNANTFMQSIVDYRVCCDSMSNPIKVTLKLNKDSELNYNSVKYVVVNDGVTYKEVDIYLQIGAYSCYSYILTDRSKNKHLYLLNEQPLVSIDSLTSYNAKQEKIIYGSVEGTFVEGALEKVIALPKEIITAKFASCNCSYVSAGSIADVSCNIQITDRNNLKLFAKNPTNPTSNYIIMYMLVGEN